MSVTTVAQLAKAEALARYLTARMRLDAALADEALALRMWDRAVETFGAGPGADGMWAGWMAAAEVRAQEARALAEATAELQDAMRGVGEAGGESHG